MVLYRCEIIQHFSVPSPDRAWLVIYSQPFSANIITHALLMKESRRIG